MLTTVIKPVCNLVSNDIADSAIIEVSEIQIIYLLLQLLLLKKNNKEILQYNLFIG